VAAALGVLVLVQAGCADGEGEVSLDDLTNGDDGERITVFGSGSASAAPDRVAVRLGVETMAETASDALSENSEQIEAVINALTEAGIPEEDIQTQTVELRPQYESPEPRPEQGAQRELVGYVASNVVEVTSDELDGFGELLDAAVQAGANRVEGIRFEVTNQMELLGQAREAAWEDAEAKAQQLADLAGAQLGDVISIDESTRVPRPAGLRVEAEEAAAVPIQPGREEIRVDLQVTWALE
jgi:hypothetical protein